MGEPEDGSSSTASQLGRYGGYGITLGLAVALFAWLGTLADERLGTEPLFVLLGSFLGFGAGFYRLIRDLAVTGEDGADGDDRDEGDDGDRDEDGA
ncbi:MAG: AtpZ/AtpI family protein [Gemmatimonadota bacterium]